MTSIIDSSLETRIRAGRTYTYDPARKLFLNPETDKWVQNPVTRRKFIVSSKHVYSHPVVNSILERITSNTNELECIKYVLKRMAMKSHLQTSKDDKSIWHNVDDKTPTIWIHHHFFMQLLGYDYRTLMDKLVREGILIERDVRTVKGRFPTYLFAEPEFLSDYALEPVTCAAVDSKIESYVNWTRQYFTPLEDRITKHIVDNFWRINLTLDQFHVIWEPRYETKYLPKHPKKPMTFEKYKIQGDYIYKIIKGWNDADRTDKLSMFSKDLFGNRMHHVFSYMHLVVKVACDS